MPGAIKSTKSWPHPAAATDPPLAAALADIAARLSGAGIEAPALEARLLLGHALGCDQETLVRERARPFSLAQAAPGFEALLARRLAREPLAHILGVREFWGLAFAVSPATLVPRADSETLIEAAITRLPVRQAVRRVLDLGTGSGSLLLAALQEFPDAIGVGVDLSPAALAVAERNAAALGFAGRALFLCGDWAGAIRARFDLVLCNPPYIETASIPGLAPEVALYEPRRALDGGEDGLFAYRAVFAALAPLLAPGAPAVIELGAGQAERVAALAVAQGFAHVTHVADLSGIPRALIVAAPEVG
jgi:release factor glutamine methyltransferase